MLGHYAFFEMRAVIIFVMNGTWTKRNGCIEKRGEKNSLHEKQS
jgi:hypothetical protein